MPTTTRPPLTKRIGRLRGLAVTILGAVVLATSGIPTLGVAAAADLVATAAPTASASPAPTASPAPEPTASALAAPDPGAVASPDPAALAAPAPTVSPTPAPAALAAPVATPRAKPKGAIATRTLKGQPYRLPTFVRPVKWRVSPVSFYGPGFYCVSNRVKGCVPQHARPARLNRTACGVLYTRNVVGVAHRTLPCGTLVAFSYRGRTVVAPVIDRGPYVAGRTWDLSGGLCTALRHCFTGPIRATVVHRATGRARMVRVHLSRR